MPSPAPPADAVECAGFGDEGFFLQEREAFADWARPARTLRFVLAFHHSHDETLLPAPRFPQTRGFLFAAFQIESKAAN